jgi:murein tripeptide amidase MpaA
MLNPDGADMYTRLNANEVDLNRDSQNLTQPESAARNDLFQPHCFNLHDQRFWSRKPATTSLAPSYNEERE